MRTFTLEFLTYQVENATIRYAPVAWDTETFGFPVYELRLRELELSTPQLIRSWLETLPKEKGCLVFAKLDQQNVRSIQALVGNGFYPVETVLEVEGNVSRVSAGRASARARMRPATPDDVRRLAEIARKAFWSDRFHIDPNVPNDAADARYAQWVTDAIQDGEWVSVLEADDDNRIIGFYHLRTVSSDRVDLSLIALDPLVSGRGIGRTLYDAMIEESACMGFESVSTRIAARNLPALNTLAHLGFSFRGALTSLHWFAVPVKPSGSG
jgi:RimJ/RimL family protein N-acetyltransferase